MRKERFLSIALTTIVIAGAFAGLTFARMIEPEYVDIAYFELDPYPRGTNIITYYYRHDSPGFWMYITLVDPNNNNYWMWGIPPFAEGEREVPISRDIDGIWTLKYNTAYSACLEDHALFHSPGYSRTEGLVDPATEQANLATDWARNPDSCSISTQALEIIGNTVVSSYQAAIDIHDHIYASFNHGTFFNWRRDVDLLTDLLNTGQYHGVCRSDAVLLTAYARSLGIPARIISLKASRIVGTTVNEEQQHFFAELYVKIGSDYQWVPVDADPNYGWFGLSNANDVIRQRWPASESWHIAILIVKQVNGETDNDFLWVEYPYWTLRYNN